MRIFSNYLFFTYVIHLVCSSHMVPKSINCLSIDPELVKFDMCQLSTTKNKGMDIIIRLLKPPVRKILWTVQFLYGKYFQMSMINNTWDFCQLMKKRKSGSVFGRVYDYVASYSNLNHTCPYNHDISIRNFTLLGKNTIIPVPSGQWQLNVNVSTDGRASVYVSVITDVLN